MKYSDLDVYQYDRSYRQLAEESDAYSRIDESDDAEFYGQDRMVEHLDETALRTVENLLERLIIEKHPSVLDLMASIDSHIPADLCCGKVAGLGLNRNELEANARLEERIVHDINKEPVLPFPDRSFDIVVNTASIQYVVHPRRIFQEVARILKPGGLLVVIFSNRSFPTKAVKVWEILTEEEKIKLVIDYFIESGKFEEPETFISMGKPRPPGDRYASTGLPGDPVFAVYAESKGGDPARPARQKPDQEAEEIPDGELEERKTKIPETLRCPYCDRRLRLWAVTENPLTTWDHDLYICANDSCPYTVGGWGVMFRQGNNGISYRLCYDPKSETVLPIPIPNLAAIKNELRD